MKKILIVLSLAFFTSTLFISCADAVEETAETTESSTESAVEDSENVDYSQYEKVTGKYTSFSFGDLAHYIFIVEDGKEMDFTQNKDESMTLEVDDDNADQGIGMNSAMKDKTFDIYYKVEKVTPAGWDEADAMDANVIYKLEEVK